jgi:hypothetical protein
MVTVKIRREIECAVTGAKDYVKGKNLGRLRAAFDGLCSQICHDLVGARPINRMMARKLLNDAAESNPHHERGTLMRALSAALRECEHTLFRKDYVDHSQSIERFILGELRDVLRALP